MNTITTHPSASSGTGYDRSATITGGRSAPQGIYPAVQPKDARGYRPEQSSREPRLLGRETLEKLASEANQLLPSSTKLHFQVDGELNRVVVKVVDTESDSVIRQIPNEEMVGLVKRMRSFRSGLMVATA